MKELINVSINRLRCITEDDWADVLLRSLLEIHFTVIRKYIKITIYCNLQLHKLLQYTIYRNLRGITYSECGKNF